MEQTQFGVTKKVLTMALAMATTLFMVGTKTTPYMEEAEKTQSTAAITKTLFEAKVATIIFTEEDTTTRYTEGMEPILFMAETIAISYMEKLATITFMQVAGMVTIPFTEERETIT